MRQLFLPPNSSKSAYLQGTIGSFSTTNPYQIALPDGIWQSAVLFIGGNSNGNSYRGCLIQCGTDKTKSQSFCIENASGGFAYNGFYSKIGGASYLCPNTQIWPPSLNDVWIDTTNRPNIFNIQWASGSTITYACYSITVYK